jgi:NitT/TauT family transport system ATP-binding protein
VSASARPIERTGGSPVTFEHVWCVFEHRTGKVVRALEDVSLTAPQGQFVSVVGRSGHGKTTLLRILAGLQPPTSGRVLVGDRPVAGPGSDRAMVFQQDTVFPWMHVRDNVEFGLAAQGIGKAERRRISDRWVREVGLEGFADSWPRELSGGMRKRVALASVLAVGANVWLMDEPFGSLDYFTRRTLHELLLELWQEANKTVFFVTHDIEEAMILADRVLLMRDGRLVNDLEVNLPRPRDEDVRASAEAVTLQKEILRHLGFDSSERDEAAPSLRTETVG